MNIDNWLDECLPRHKRLTEVIESTIKSILFESKIEHLSVIGRVKTKKSITEKIRRKNYKYPQNQLTDISGIRIVLFIESEVDKAYSLLEYAFNVDAENSSNRERALSADQVGYRSVHLVCELSDDRLALPEFSAYGGLKFEIQIRTVLQHAWAELSHDRAYKFQGDLPKHIQRKLYLHAGLLELADKGFNELAAEIDNYIEDIGKEYENKNLNQPINSLSISEYMRQWSMTNNLKIDPVANESLVKIIHELKEFGVSNIDELQKIIPETFAKTAKRFNYRTNTLGIIRDWMILSNPQKILEEIEKDWLIIVEKNSPELQIYKQLASKSKYETIKKHIEYEDDDDDDDE